MRAIYSGPIDRARETAAPLAERLGLAVHVRDALTELDVGEWQGKPLADLDADPRWAAWNRARSLTRAPGGEMMCAAQARMVGELFRLGELHPDQCVAIVSHGDPIRSALCYFLGISLDHALRFEIS